ncbi:ABC transporter ATP-binding protein [Pusillimonas sp.]|uniref:ABC transporter ATP-binding protein n=1 Tax=Pusillimonas sp. TaxID=3040095 RepID=UPI0029AF79D6|nr:ABC transporter ATP-binding protein [Pusillimonas sp.]MDX3895589.1 ABC transporter ATP-binding protein [Pusillimonas sp.]
MISSMPLLSVEKLVKRFRGITATDKVCFDILEGETHALIGPNGAGKTTLISQIMGETKPDEGRILFSGKDMTALPVHQRTLLGMGRSYQITSTLPELTVLQNVMLGALAKRRQGVPFWSVAAADTQLRKLALEAMERAGIASAGDTQAKNLDHGASRQLELAMVLAMRPRLLLLDEPMAGMSERESADMISQLQSLKSQVTILLVEHDLKAVFALADRVTVLVYGQVIASGSVAEIRSNPAVRAAYLGDDEDEFNV